MGNPPPLSVDPEQLSTAGGQLLDSAAQLPPAPAPFKPFGKDPLSAAIISQIPAIDDPVMPIPSWPIRVDCKRWVGPRGIRALLPCSPAR